MSDYHPLANVAALHHTPVTATRHPQTARQPGSQATEGKSPTQIDKACQDLESLFVYYLLKEMRASIPDAGLLPADKSKAVYTSIMDAEMAKQLAQGRGIGLAAMLRQQLAGSMGSSNTDETP